LGSRGARNGGGEGGEGEEGVAHFGGDDEVVVVGEVVRLIYRDVQSIKLQTFRTLSEVFEL
jgi:hypothetical protein